MHHTDLFSLKYMPLLIRLRCCESAQLPSYLGSTLHGVVGWKLMSVDKYIYRYLFENRRYESGKQDIVNPYFLEPPRYKQVYRQGDMLSFTLVLLGNAADMTIDVVKALASGDDFEIGSERKKFQLLDVLHAESLEPIWSNGKIVEGSAVTSVLTPLKQDGITRCSVHFITPLRIRRGGEQLRQLDFPTIIRSITRRLSLLTERYGGHVDTEEILNVCQLAHSVRTISSGVYWSELNRYSNRRNVKMDLSGLMGAMTFEGDMSRFASWLYAARFLHIGRNVTFGCGQLDVVFR